MAASQRQLHCNSHTTVTAHNRRLINDYRIKKAVTYNGPRASRLLSSWPRPEAVSIIKTHLFHLFLPNDVACRIGSSGLPQSFCCDLTTNSAISFISRTQSQAVFPLSKLGSESIDPRLIAQVTPRKSGRSLYEPLPQLPAAENIRYKVKLKDQADPSNLATMNKGADSCH